MSGPDPAAWGISAGHHHVGGQWVPVPSASENAALAAMGADSPEPPLTTTWVVTEDEAVHLPSPATLTTEDGESQRLPAGRLGPVANGYHWLDFDDRRVRLIVSPGACVLPARRLCGWAVQLYATRSSASWGIGDLADLRRLGHWAAADGAGMLVVNPLNAVAPTVHQEPSPYFPTTRRWRNPLYLRVEEVPGAATLAGAELAELAALAIAGRALNGARRIDRDQVWRLKSAALDVIWRASARNDTEFAAWAAGQGEGLSTYSRFAALSEIHGGDWRVWPAPLRRPDSFAVSEWAVSPLAADRITFHAWLQWLVDRQLAAVGSAGSSSGAFGPLGVALVGDLPIGADPGGADAWAWQDVLAAGVTVGAPPDDFSPTGQDWGFPPFDPWRLRAAGYGPFIEVLRAALAHGSGLRIDHALGLFRQFWVPSGTRPAGGVYVNYPWADLCNIVALESQRAGAWIVGEDLGTVEPWVRDQLAARRLLSSRLLWFEDGPTSSWPPAALATITTHDLPTVSGVWNDTDATVRRQLGIAIDAGSEAGLRRRLEAASGVSPAPGVRPSDVACRAYAALADSPCLLVAATLEDALEVDERVNLPGTQKQRPNWSLALPLDLEAIERDPRVAAVAAALRRDGPTMD